MSAHPELIAQDQQFPKHIVELAPNVHGAVGFAASSVYMITGDDGVIIVDTTETTKAAENILAEGTSGQCHSSVLRAIFARVAMQSGAVPEQKSVITSISGV